MPTPNRTEKLHATAAKLNATPVEDVMERAARDSRREMARMKRHRRIVETQLARIADALEIGVLVYVANEFHGRGLEHHDRLTALLKRLGARTG
jgi:hypothetical protein